MDEMQLALLLLAKTLMSNRERGKNMIICGGKNQTQHAGVARFQQIKAQEKARHQAFQALPEAIRRQNPKATPRALEALFVLACEAHGFGPKW